MNKQPERKTQCWQVRAVNPTDIGYKQNIYIGVIASTVEECLQKFRAEYPNATIDAIVQHYGIHIL